MAIAGHVSQKMLAHYSHVRLEAKRNALDALSKPTSNVRVSDLKRKGEEGETGGYVTTHVTNDHAKENIPTELLEKNGRHDWTRTSDLYRVKVAL